MSGIWSGVFVSAEVCDSRNWNSRSNIAWFERRLRGAAPTPLALRCPFRTSTSTRTDAERDKREVAKIPHVEEEFRRFRMYLSLCLQRLNDLQSWHHFQTVLDSVCNFALAYSRALVSLLYFFTSSFGFLPGLFIAFVSARFASWKFVFSVWVHLKRDTSYRRYPTTSRYKLPTARRFVTKELPNHDIFT